MARIHLLSTVTVALTTLLIGCSRDGYEARIVLSVTPGATGGQFLVKGVTTLPIGSIIAVDALRYLNVPGQPRSHPVFAVLARQEITTNAQSQWQILLDTAPTGKEIWQTRYATITPPVKPLGKDIVFRATWLPENQPLKIQSILGGQGQELRGLQILNTGRSQYIRVNFPLAADPPGPRSRILPSPSPDPMQKWRRRQDPLIYRHFYSR